MLSSIVPLISPPIVWASGMFMYAAATAVAIVSNRSPTLTTTSGLSMPNIVGSSSRPRPVDLAIVPGVSPSTIIVTFASGLKPSDFDHVDHRAEAIEQRRRADDEL